MSIEVRPFDSLGRFDNDWLKARYHFSFASYHDPARMGLGPLCVWNDDSIRPGSGFDPHPHRDMEVITYVRRGAITHQDSEGNRGRTAAGDVQVMSAGSGIVHAEYNLEDEPTDLFQIWIEPRRGGLTPRWASRAFPKGDRADRLIALASGRQGMAGALEIDQDATLFGATITAGASVAHGLGAGRQAYLVPLGGAVTVNGVRAAARSGVVVTQEPEIALTAEADAEIVLADLPA